MKIGDAAKKCGLPVKTVRYYADIGLISPARQTNHYRDFDAGTIETLILLGRARALDFSISECKDILKVAEANSAKKIASGHNIDHLVAKLLKRRGDIEELEKILTSVSHI